MRAALFLLLSLFLPAAALAADKPVRLPRGEDVQVAAISDGRTLALADGRQVRLAGIMLPETGNDAQVALRALIGDGPVLRLARKGLGTDRHGRLVGHLFREDGLWLHEALLRQGLVFLAGQPDPSGRFDAMRAAESRARAEGLGLWAEPAAGPRDAGSLRAEEGGFRIVTGTVQRVARVGDRVYLNFGRDWRRDFTVEIERRDLRAFTRAGLDPMALEGRRVEVRGWVEARNGPAIRAADPQQIVAPPPRADGQTAP